MRLRILFFCSLLILKLSTLRAAEEADPWVKYIPRTMSQIIQEEVKSPRYIGAKMGSDYFSAASFPSRSKARFTGKFQSVPAWKKEFIRRWAKSFSHPSDTATLFDTEFLFVEGKRHVWLPVQDSLVEEFRKVNLHENDQPTLFITFLGARKVKGGIEPIIIINGFQ